MVGASQKFLKTNFWTAVRKKNDWLNDSEVSYIVQGNYHVCVCVCFHAVFMQSGGMILAQILKF